MEKVKVIRRKSFKSLSMIVERDGTVVVKAPPSVSEERISKFLKENQNWIQRVLKKYKEKGILKKYQNGEKFLYLGREYELEIVKGQAEPLVLKDKFYLSSDALSQARDVFIAWYKKQANRVISDRVKHYALLGEYTYNKMTVKDLKKLWGSCSRNKNLNFNWRVIMAPLDIVDYVVVHELSHLKEFNHGERFWKLVEKFIPDYEEKDMWLRKNGHLLDL